MVKYDLLFKHFNCFLVQGLILKIFLFKVIPNHIDLFLDFILKSINFFILLLRSALLLLVTIYLILILSLDFRLFNFTLIIRHLRKVLLELAFLLLNLGNQILLHLIHILNNVFFININLSTRNRRRNVRKVLSKNCLLFRIDLASNQMKSNVDFLSLKVENNILDLLLVLINVIFLVLNFDLFNCFLSCVSIVVKVPVFDLLVFVVKSNLLIDQKVVSVLINLDSFSSKYFDPFDQSIVESQWVENDLPLDP